jgi:hypothetical protein
MKTILCLISNFFSPHPPVLLIVRKNTNSTAEHYRELFMELITIVDSAGLLPCSLIINNLLAQSSELEIIMRDNNLPVIQIKYFTHMADLVLANTVLTGNFARIMRHHTELQNLLQSSSVREVIGKKCPGSSELDDLT